MRYAILENGKGFDYINIETAAINFYQLRLDINNALRCGVRWPDPWHIQLVSFDELNRCQVIDEFKF